MRWMEVSLFLAPFILFAAWLVAARRAQPALVWPAVAMIALLAAGTVWFGLSRRLDRGQSYVPAHWADGRIVPGHGVPP